MKNQSGEHCRKRGVIKLRRRAETSEDLSRGHRLPRRYPKRGVTPALSYSALNNLEPEQALAMLFVLRNSSSRPVPHFQFKDKKPIQSIIDGTPKGSQEAGGETHSWPPDPRIGTRINHHS